MKKSSIKTAVLIIIAMVIATIFTLAITNNKTIETAISTTKEAAVGNLPDNIRVTKLSHIGSNPENWIIYTDSDSSSRTYCTQPGTTLNTGDYFTAAQNETLYTQNDTYNNCTDNMYDVGYIISYNGYYNGSSWTNWSLVTQHALWRTGVSGTGNLGNDEYAREGLSLYNKSQWYKTFYEQIVARSSVSDPKMNPTNQTNSDEVVVLSNTDNKTETIGPFKVDYVDQTNDNKLVKFGGISDMYLVDDAGNKISITNIQTENLHYYYPDINSAENGVNKQWKNYGAPSYFPTEQGDAPNLDANLQDNWDFMRFYPDSGENFYVEYDTTQTVVGSLHLHVEFAWLKCSGSFTFRRSVGKNASAGYWFINNSRDFVQSSGSISQSHQSGMILISAGRELVKESLDVYFPNANKDATMKLGGYVFEDTPTGKESLSNGTMGSEDKMLQNIKVTLYEQNADGTYTQAKLMTLLATKFTIPNLTDAEKEEYRYDKDKAIELANRYIETLKSQQGDNSALISEIETAIADSQKEEDYTRRINPTLTDSKGYYEFRGINTQKKYVVKFEYNGQDYIPTDYLTTNANQNSEVRYDSVQSMVKAGVYSGDNANSTNQENETWRVTSKGTEYSADRTKYDNKFSEIASNPHNYVSSNSLKYLSSTYNETFTELQLMGYTLSSDGKYSQTGTQLVDGYLKDENGDDTANYQDGVISEAIKQYIKDNKNYPDETAMKSIYDKIANGNATVQKELQFIEDCKINSWTKNNSDTIDQYPAYSQFTTNSKNVTINKVTGASVSNGYSGATIVSTSGDVSNKTEENVTYYAIYNGQLEINQGLWRRQESDIALRKDAYKATVKINGKTEVYNYNKRQSEDSNYWDINVRMSDYNSYYGTGYNRELYSTDYNAVSNDTIADKLDVYVTYKITVRNQSQSVLMEIPEVVDYFDSTYTYRDDLSWVTYTNNEVTDDQYYTMMNSQSNLSTNKGNTTSILNAKATNSTEGSSMYGKDTQQDIENGNGYNSVYVKGLADKKLASGESEYVYLTFEVKTDNTGKITLGTKENLAEINGYKTFYKDGTTLPNKVNKNSSDVAGIIDRDSNPGNLTMNAINNKVDGKYEQNFEDDTDRSKTINITVSDTSIRGVNGAVWEENRDKAVENSEIGNGTKDNGEKAIEAVKVQLWDVDRNQVTTLWNGSSWVNAEMDTDSDGKYSFSGYLPGNYIVKFTYGDRTYSGTQYNAQDYKSTIYNAQTGFNVDSPDDDDIYNFLQADTDTIKNTNNQSDARDLLSIRQNVNNYCNNNVNGTQGEVTNALAQELKNAESNQDANIEAMTARSAKIIAEVEYGRQNTNVNADGNSYIASDSQNTSDNYQNVGSYQIQNLDFGLTERPKAQLELLKQVTNVKVTLANGNTLLDASQKATNVMWVNTSKIPYEGYKNNLMLEPKMRQNSSQKGKVQLTMDEELMHGATIKITYAIVIANTGEVDYKDNNFYYLGNETDVDTNIVKTKANTVIDYTGYQGTTDGKATRNNLKYDQTQNGDWAIASENNMNILNTDIKKSATDNYNTIITTNKLNSELIPVLADKTGKDIVEKMTKSTTTVDDITAAITNYATSDKKSITLTPLVLSQTLSSENTSDDMTYNNMAEIISTNNTVGRRMAYSVVGNQDPTAEPAEVDADDAQEITILPPFGQKHYQYYIIAGVAIILIAGIIIIKKKVLKK